MTGDVAKSWVGTIISRAISDAMAPSRPVSDHEAFHRFRRKDVFALQLPLRQALLMRVAQESIERFLVLLEAVAPVIISHQPPRILYMGAQPGQHDLEGCGFLQFAVDAALRLGKSLVKRLRDPAI